MFRPTMVAIATSAGGRKGGVKARMAVLNGDNALSEHDVWEVSTALLFCICLDRQDRAGFDRKYNDLS
jgi:hypothetical protein